MARSRSTRDGGAGRCPVRGRNSESAKQTIGKKRGRTVGPRSAAHARPSSSGNGDRERSRPARGARRVRRRCPRTPTGAAPGGCSASCRAPYPSSTGGWSSERPGTDFARSVREHPHWLPERRHHRLPATDGFRLKPDVDDSHPGRRQSAINGHRGRSPIVMPRSHFERQHRRASN